ncbi:MAG: c-type cytochrome [Kofleriaceae bacterium]
MRFGVAAFALLLAGTASADWDDEGPNFIPPKSFALAKPIGDVKPGKPVPAFAQSSRIAALDTGALVIDADSGWLIRTGVDGAPLDHLAIGIEAGTLAYDPVGKRAYVADRRGDRIAVISVGEKLELVASWKTPAEPYGVALTPDRSTVLVSAIADRALVAFDPSGKEKWRTPLDAEPRGVAISANGTHAAVAMLSVGALDQVELDGKHRLFRLPLALTTEGGDARGSFAAAYLGEHLIATTAQLERPAASEIEPDHYGGGALPPLGHAIAFVDERGTSGTSITSVNEARALAWDPTHDNLFVAGMASDSLVIVKHGSQVDAALGGTASLETRCGADGIAIAGDGSALVWCSFPRTIVHVDVATLKAKAGPELAASNMDPKQHQGMVVFHTANDEVSAFGGMSCGNCHLDGRSDGESWFIHGERLQTPMLAGRIANTAPYKWDGGAKDLPASLRATVKRLGGRGLSKKNLAALADYVNAMPAIRTPSRDHAAVARGKALFESASLGCTQCHDGPAFTDRQMHAFGKSKQEFDTPSLLGIAASAPYFHDGSAPTLDTLLRDHGTVHGMASDGSTQLTDAQRADLVAYLETL